MFFGFPVKCHRSKEMKINLSGDKVGIVISLEDGRLFSTSFINPTMANYCIYVNFSRNRSTLYTLLTHNLHPVTIGRNYVFAYYNG